MADLEEEIFGADSDDDIFNDKSDKIPAVQIATSVMEPSQSFLGDEDDDLFRDSDDEVTNKGAGKLKKLGSSAKKGHLGDGLVDSDDEDDRNTRKREKKRRREERKNSKKEKRIKRRENEREGSDKERSSGDEYDSGEEVQENQEDRDFIDEDDDLADIRNEYNEDSQVFDDERPEKGSKKKKLTISSGGGGGGIGYIPKTKDLDPLSQTLIEIRKPKFKDLSDAEKDQVIEKLLRKMARAVELDDECFRRKEPAIHKLKLLPMVQRAVSMKSLHNTLLDKDILCYLRDWIEPKNASTLPALSLRTAVYEMLLKLPALTEHLKRGNDKVPIGYVIVSLRKHKLETPENKRLLKEIMDKWSRPIFSKTEGAGPAFVPGDNEEIKTALARKYSENGVSDPALSRSASSLMGGILGGSAAKKEADLSSRARAPVSHGYLFTVQPELKTLDKRNVMEKALGEDRMKLFKKMTEGGKSSSTGKKTNPRAMNISVSGNNLKH